MTEEKIQLPKKTARGFIQPIGPVNLVFAVTDVGMVGCGAFDVMALDKYQYPAARLRPGSGTSIGTIQNLLDGIVKDTNAAAQKLGVHVGMSGKEALMLM
jgi:uncharacterized protein YunC (DUF1805 family)